MNYPVPAAPVEVEYEVKKSRFIARVVRVNNRDEAMAMRNQVIRDYPDASHHCWAYLIGNPESASSAAMSDDGEPSGTAGKPILNVLQHKGVGDVMVIVIRYFGGIRLGAGGLVRAYSASAQKAMEQVQTSVQQSTVTQLITFDFSQEQRLRHWLFEHQGKVLQIEYGQQVAAAVSIPEAQVALFRQFLASQRMKFYEEPEA